MGNTTLGYIFSIVGLVFIVAGFSSIKTVISTFIPFLASVASLYLQLAGGVCIILGVFFMMGKGSSKQPKEVPIYHGKNIVGYRRQ